MQVWAFYNLKGGVGKTSTAVNIAWQASQAGHRVLLWDLDPQGAASFYLGADKRGTARASKLARKKTPIGKVIRRTKHRRLDVIPADFSYRNWDLMLKKADASPKLIKKLLAPCGEDYALVILDCPPSMSRLADNLFTAADRIFVPVIPSALSLRSWHQVRERVRALNLPIDKLAAFFSMVDTRRKGHREIVANPPIAPAQCLRTRIPYAVDIEKMGEQRAPVGQFAPKRPAATVYRALWKEMRKRAGGP